MTNYLLQYILDETASRYPDKVAIKMGDACITYKDLQDKSNQLANFLIETGFKPRHTAGILFNKSIESIIAFIGVLKAGGAYIPLDLHYSPAERIKHIISLSEMEFLITDSSNLTELMAHVLFDPHMKTMRIVCLDDIYREEPSEAIAKPLFDGPGKFYFLKNRYSSDLLHEQETTEDDLAYILYTSGSTGTPKGVMISHLNALSFINWSLNFFGPSHHDVFSSHAPFHFDLSVFDIYVSLASGACLNIAPSAICNNPRALIEWISTQKITTWYSVPSVWISIMNYARINREKLDALKYVLFAGEVFPPKYLKKLMAALPHASYYNLYGPTETNVCTCHHVNSPDEINDRPVPIGKACANTEVLALNENGMLVSAGEEGELMVRGSTVTRGYYKNPEKTRDAFMVSPLSCHNGALLYKTGDIVRKRDGDTYEYVGRKDLMVKCSGYRIEIPEIEHALCHYDPIEESVVVPVSDEDRGTTILHAFVKMKAGQDFSVMKTKKHLGLLLPRYMIPEQIEKVENIPKNANGKIDRPQIMDWAKTA
ncbi:MAG: amino acid adenylation domain-containing protein [Proteobacteria bacterium]|nr:amino acid adenylation domain-containing protein [Pseudomonadota bacterium]